MDTRFYVGQEKADRFSREYTSGPNGLSSPENEAFIELAEKVKEMTQYAQDHKLTIAVMGCRVNGPGETDDADLGRLPGQAQGRREGRLKTGASAALMQVGRYRPNEATGPPWSQNVQA